jgi:ATP sulfurylase
MLSIGDTVGLTNDQGETIALLRLAEKFNFDQDETIDKLFGTRDDDHPGVRMIRAMKPILLAGEIDLIKGRHSETRAYELTPKQLRRLFEDRGWAKVLGFHTRNVLHWGHEFMQLKAMEDENCDGLLVQPVVGKKKPGDFKPEYIIKSYEKMIENFYPKERVVFAAFSTYYLGMKIVKFNEIFFSKKSNEYIHDNGEFPHDESDKLRMISGSQAREMFLRGEKPPGWFMRPDLSKIVLDAVKNGEQVFEEDDI